MDWLVDTNVLIDHLRGVKKASLFLRQARKQNALWVSVITIAEIYAGQKTRDANEAVKVRRLLRFFRVAYLDGRISAHGGAIARDYAVELPDALIAATALKKGLRLATRNIKHFQHIPNLTVQAPY
ncbi:MAG: type II toxin-antitoxin system VapC family toxin [Blastocatellia bacterium]